MVELCEWMLSEGLVAGGMITEKAKEQGLAALVPPSMTALVQAQMDELPTLPGMVLRYASVLGVQFSSAVLCAMLQSSKVVDEKHVLDSQLQLLQTAHLINPTAQLKFGLSSSRPEGNNYDWQVRENR